jgi:iron complex transport system substrate-binding protein
LEPRGGYDKARKYGFYTAQDSRGRFFTDLGFVVPEDLVKLAGTSFYADISNERIDLFDRDLIVFVGLQFAEGVRAAIEIDPLLKPLKAVKEGRVVYVPANYDDALQFSSVLSIEFALKGNVPELQTALGLKPAATAQATAAATAAK